jgi:hypothetical protein
VQDKFRFDCLGVQHGLDDVRGILADCFYDDCAEVACRAGLESPMPFPGQVPPYHLVGNQEDRVGRRLPNRSLRPTRSS